MIAVLVFALALLGLVCVLLLFFLLQIVITFLLLGFDALPLLFVSPFPLSTSFLLLILRIIIYSLYLHQKYRLVGLVVKVSASRAEDPGFQSRLRLNFSGVESYQ